MTAKQLYKYNDRLYSLVAKYNRALVENDKYVLKRTGEEIDTLRNKYFSLLDKKF